MAEKVIIHLNRQLKEVFHVIEKRGGKTTVGHYGVGLSLKSVQKSILIDIRGILLLSKT